MDIMNKFKKRLSKISRHHNNAVVVGDGFGKLETILEIYNTVFVISDTYPTIKARNLVYRENFDNLNQLTNIDVIFFNLNTVNYLSTVKDFWQRNKSFVVIEGNTPIGRDVSLPLYETGWGCTSVQEIYHIWEHMK